MGEFIKIPVALLDQLKDKRVIVDDFFRGLSDLRGYAEGEFCDESECYLLRFTIDKPVFWDGYTRESSYPKEVPFEKNEYIRAIMIAFCADMEIYSGFFWCDAADSENYYTLMYSENRPENW